MGPQHKIRLEKVEKLAMERKESLKESGNLPLEILHRFEVVPALVFEGFLLTSIKASIIVVEK